MSVQSFLDVSGFHDTGAAAHDRPAASVDALRADAIGASYAGQRGTLEVFRDVTVEIARGTTLGIFGPNGTGKTTLLRGLAGLVPISGTLNYPPPRTGTTCTLASVPQRFAESFYPWASLEANLLFHLPEPFTQSKRNRKIIRDTHDRLGLKLDLSRRPGECSGGMLQQAALIRAFARRPDVLIADEPFSALDFDVAGHVREGFRAAVRELGICALLVLHSIEDLLEVCDSVLAIPGRPYTTNASLNSYAHAHVFANHQSTKAPRAQGRSSEPAIASTSGSPFLSAIRNALGAPS